MTIVMSQEGDVVILYQSESYQCPIIFLKIRVLVVGIELNANYLEFANLHKRVFFVLNWISLYQKTS